MKRYVINWFLYSAPQIEEYTDWNTAKSTWNRICRDQGVSSGMLIDVSEPGKVWIVDYFRR